MSHRHEQLESTLKRALQQALAQGLNDPRATGAMITVTGLTITHDLKTASVLVTVYPSEKQDLVMHAIRHAAPHLRHEAAELVSMRTLPQLTFALDTALKKQVEVLEALRKVGQEREAKAAAATPPLSTGTQTGGNNAAEAGTA